MDVRAAFNTLRIAKNNKCFTAFKIRFGLFK